MCRWVQTHACVEGNGGLVDAQAAQLEQLLELDGQIWRHDGGLWVRLAARTQEVLAANLSKVAGWRGSKREAWGSGASCRVV